MIAHYRVVRFLGCGGMGEVYLAEDTELERSVALKVMTAELARDTEKRSRFLAEARAAAGLSHPNICVIHEVDETQDGRPFLAMEYVQGQPLDVLLQKRRFTLREVVDLGLQAAEALEAAHGRGLVHRDIKPANLMVDARGRLKVLDFGLAKRLPAHDELSADASSVSQTKSGVLLGTPSYMSPEQALGREIDPRSDIFSLGVVLYELIAGQRPFLGKTVGELINNIINQPAQSLGIETPPVSPALDGIVLKCLEKDPQKRYETAGALAHDLAEIKKLLDQPQPQPQAQSAKESTARDVKPPARRTLELVQRKPGRGLVLAASIVLVLGLLAALGTHWFGASKAGNSSIDGIPANSVAVLPFNNFSAEPDTEYLSDGLTEEITTALSRIHGLKVAARNSAFVFKGKQQDARSIGAALRVSTLLEGSVRKVGDQIRVSAQLINAADGYHLWSDSYDRPVKDIISVQEDIAHRK